MVDCPSVAEIERGMRAFRQHEPRDAMYRVAAFLVEHFWGEASQIADGLGVLLLTWNNAFYRFGSFDFDALERCIRQNQATLDAFRNRDIETWSSRDDGPASTLFQQLSASLRIREGKAKGRRSPVAAAKAMHVLAPAFFPIWDNKIALKYECPYDLDPSESYLKFARTMKRCVRLLEEAGFKVPTGKTMLKVIDEYNYAKFTKGWICTEAGSLTSKWSRCARTSVQSCRRGARLIWIVRRRELGRLSIAPRPLCRVIDSSSRIC